jgi:hypothetical protein
MALKDYYESDMKTFFSNGEFSDYHEIDGVQKLITLDSESIKALSKAKFQGTSAGEILYFIPTSIYGPNKPEIGASQIFDDALMYITNVSEDLGVYEITLSQYRGD